MRNVIPPVSSAIETLIQTERPDRGALTSLFYSSSNRHLQKAAERSPFVEFLTLSDTRAYRLFLLRQPRAFRKSGPTGQLRSSEQSVASLARPRYDCTTVG